MDIVDWWKMRPVSLDANTREWMKNATAEIERLREALQLIVKHPVQESGQWEISAKEMVQLARNTLKETE